MKDFTGQMRVASAASGEVLKAALSADEGLVRGNSVRPQNSYPRTLRRHTSDATLIARSIV